MMKPSLMFAAACRLPGLSMAAANTTQLLLKGQKHKRLWLIEESAPMELHQHCTAHDL